MDKIARLTEPARLTEILADFSEIPPGRYDDFPCIYGVFRAGSSWRGRFFSKYACVF